MERLDERLGEDPHPEDPLFSHGRGVGWHDPSNVHRGFRKVLSESDLAWIATHVFRKTTATMLDDAGFSPGVVADQLGHARPSLTQDVYVHLARNTVHPEAASALESVQRNRQNNGVAMAPTGAPKRPDAVTWCVAPRGSQYPNRPPVIHGPTITIQRVRRRTPVTI
jgi:hypothetical protein